MLRLTRRTRRQAGFTLIELVVVMVIIAILAGAVTLKVLQNVKQAKRTKAIADIATMKTALQMYAAHNGAPPSQQQGLAALIAKPTGAPAPPNWQGPYLDKKTVPLDPWGHEYVYTVSGEDEYSVVSYGADGQPGGEGNDNADVDMEAAQ